MANRCRPGVLAMLWPTVTKRRAITPAMGERMSAEASRASRSPSAVRAEATSTCAASTASLARFAVSCAAAISRFDGTLPPDCRRTR